MKSPGDTSRERVLVLKSTNGGTARRDAAVYELTTLGTSFAEGPLAHLARWAAENPVVPAS